MKVLEPLPPISEAPDELWAMIEPVLAEHGPPKRGPKRIDQRAALDAVIFRLRSGCQWNRLPPEYPDDSSVHRMYQRLVGPGIFDRIWAIVHDTRGCVGGCDWEWEWAMPGWEMTSSDRTRSTAPGLA